MTVNRFKKEIIFRLERREIAVNAITVKGFKDNQVASVEVSINSYGSANVLDSIKDALDEIELVYGISVYKRLVEF